jgi:hypothetical protein
MKVMEFDKELNMKVMEFDKELNMKVVEVDSKTGVPIHPEDILDTGKIPSFTGGVSKKFLIGGLTITVLFPLMGFIFGYAVYKQPIDGFILMGMVFVFNYLTIKVIAWMTKE